jgi:SAM-dependent methyltransferase
MGNACAICGSDKYKIIGKPEINEKVKRFIRHDYHVVKCLKCGFYFIDPALDLTEQEWEALYKDEYFTPMTDWWEKRRERDRKGRLDRLFSYLKTSKNANEVRFLDIGCGEGFVVAEALNRNWISFGCDIADNLPGDMKGKFSFTKGNLIQAKYPDDHFDVIYMDSVLEHVANPIQVLSEIRRILNKNGIAYIAVPNEQTLYNSVKKILYNMTGKKEIAAQIKPFESPYHIQGFNPGSLSLAVKQAGLGLEKLNIFAGEYEYTKYKIFTKPWFIELSMLPIHLFARIFKKSIYLECYLS